MNIADRVAECQVADRALRVEKVVKACRWVQKAVDTKLFYTHFGRKREEAQVSSGSSDHDPMGFGHEHSVGHMTFVKQHGPVAQKVVVLRIKVGYLKFFKKL